VGFMTSDVELSPKATLQHGLSLYTLQHQTQMVMSTYMS
jgi:hypothetical protein